MGSKYSVWVLQTILRALTQCIRAPVTWDVYVDNVAVFGTSFEVVAGAIAELRQLLEEFGLRVGRFR